MTKWYARLSRAMALPSDALRPAPRIVMSGNAELLIGGGAVLCEYTPEIVRVLRAGLEVRVSGRELRILAMDALGISVGGEIDSISFSS